MARHTIHTGKKEPMMLTLGAFLAQPVQSRQHAASSAG
ncbi:hypothetical protein GRAN_0541 [Granulicella sibirica]|uniref:Uncharacterized protein n=1 Tax=Granulicella sibirica TaxID=2479048 RepID=A0A4Q0T6M9_9BACT|nr:hypothetical protein GRAN_0541 [Granulicella sibirica]